MNEQVLTNDIINNSSDINIKEVALDGMDLLSNKKKTILKQDNTMEKNLEVSDNESVEEIDGSDLESLSGSSISELSSSASENDGSIVSSKYDDEGNFEDIQREKQELLFKLNRLEKCGYRPTKHYSMDSRIDDIRTEFKTLKKQRDLEKVLNFQEKC